ncbi:hypothetical protein [Streptomyces sp. NPDC037389]|uniref:hypothetical protein n=1 Tax=Streptomyces sp. NPDC037389 TaxID=3155369 RepID=UPI0033E3FCD6
MTMDSISITSGTAAVPAAASVVPKWAHRAAHAIPLVVLPSSLWRFLLLGGVSGLDNAGSGYRPSPAGYIYVAFLSLFSEGVALLAFGLVRPWGERVPRWIPFLGGRRVPVKAAVIPAATGAFLLTALSLYFFLNKWIFHFHPGPTAGQSGHVEFEAHGWSMVLFVCCYVPVLAWAPLLAALTYAYFKRRTTIGDMLLADARPSSRPKTPSRPRTARRHARTIE